MASPSDHQRSGQTVGSKLRAARLARKLTQSQLARPDFSVSYVSAIERDQIQPSLRALEIFAQRLGTTSTDLLSKTSGHLKSGIFENSATQETKQEIELDLLEAQLVIFQGDYLRAIELLRRLPADNLKSYQDVQQNYLLGAALYYGGFVQESESVLTRVYAKATHENDYYAKRILDTLGLAYVSMHNHTQGFECQLQNINQLEKENLPRDSFLAARIYTNIGQHYQDVNKNDDAIEMYRQALAQTFAVVTPEHLPTAYWNISKSFTETQQYFLAALYAYKTLLLLVQQYEHSMKSEIYHYLGQAILQRDGQDALPILEQFMQDATSENDTLALGSITATMAELLFKQGEHDRAFEYAQRACELALAHADSMITASIFLTSGRMAYAQKNYQEGDAQFLTGLAMIEHLNNYKEYASKSVLYAQLLEERGLPEEALKYYKKAVESGFELS